jgi:hypothetical protein
MPWPLAAPGNAQYAEQHADFPWETTAMANFTLLGLSQSTETTRQYTAIEQDHSLLGGKHSIAGLQCILPMTNIKLIALPEPESAELLC